MALRSIWWYQWCVVSNSVLLEQPEALPGRGMSWLGFPIVGSLLLAAGTLLALTGDEQALHLAVGGMALLAVSSLYFSRDQRRLNLWSFIVFSVAIGYPIRLVYVYFNFPSEELIDFFYLRGNSAAYFFWPGVAATLALFIMTASYVLVTRSAPAATEPSRPVEFDALRVRLVVGVLALLSLIGFVLFVRATGGFDASALSVKRATLASNDAQGAAQLQARGELRWLSGLGAIGYIFMLVQFTSHGRKVDAKKIVTLSLLFLLAVLLPFYSSNRGDTLAPIVATLFVLSRTGTKLNVKKLVGFGLAFVLILQVMTGLRTGGGIGDAVDEVSPSLVSDSVEALVLTRGFADFSKTAHLVQLVPRELDWDNGESIFGFAIAPVPRAVWPTKPIISKGPVLGQAIYGNNTTSGVPPGAIGELYWGFGLTGLFFGSAVLGTLIGLLERRFGARARANNSSGLVFYGAVLILAGDGLMAVGIGFAGLEVVLAAVVVTAILKVVTKPTVAGVSDRVLVGA